MNLLESLLAQKLVPCRGESVVTMAGSDAVLTPVAGNSYRCGELSSLTVSNLPETGPYSIVFFSGNTPTTTVFPASVRGLEDFAAEANTLYEINILDNRAVLASWEVTADEQLD